MGQTIKEFMSETRMLTRWQVSKVFLFGMFCGACLAVVYMIGTAVL